MRRLKSQPGCSQVIQAHQQGAGLACEGFLVLPLQTAALFAYRYLKDIIFTQNE